MSAVNEALRVYNVALDAGYDQSTAIIAAKRALDAVKVKALRVYDSATVTGAQLYHSVGDRATAIAQIGTDFALLQNDIMHDLGWTVDHPVTNEADPRTVWWRLNVVPIVNEWQKFQADTLGSWSSRFATSWDVVESWQNRLVALRKAAHDAGFDLVSPDPQPLPQTFWDGAGSGLKGIGKELWSMIKILVYAGSIIVGVVLVSRYL